MTTTFTTDKELYQFAKRLDVAIDHVKTNLENYEVEYHTAEPVAGNISPIVSRLLDGLSPQGKQSGRGESLSGSNPHSGHPDADNSHPGSREVPRVDESTGNVHPISSILVTESGMGKYLDADSDSSAGTQSGGETDSPRGVSEDSGTNTDFGLGKGQVESIPRPENQKGMEKTNRPQKRVENPAQHSSVMVKHYDEMNGHMEIDSEIYEALDRLYARCRKNKEEYVKRKIEERKP